jgi:hypothetical protein
MALNTAEIYSAELKTRVALEDLKRHKMVNESTS